MVKRQIIKIDEKKCNGCGLCIPNCPEGALQIIDKKARLVSDLFCDGLGACIGHCPQGAITTEVREAEKYNERKVMDNIVKQGKNTIIAHLKHLKDHGEMKLYKEATDYLKEKNIKVNLEEKKKVEACGCPGSAMKVIEPKKIATKQAKPQEQQSELRQWPIQLHLLNPYAEYFRNADIAFIADCVGFANPNLHSDLMRGKTIAIGCPKLDDVYAYKEKITAIISENQPKSITVAIMEVPCCGGLHMIVQEAVSDSEHKVKIEKIVVGIDGKIRK